MKTDKIEELFEGMKDQLDIHEPSDNHKIRFLKKLQEEESEKVVSIQPKTTYWLKAISIAASISIIFGVSFLAITFDPNKEVELATVSIQMEETQSFFTSAIEVQLEEINKVSSPETTKIVTDAMTQLEKLESDYETLKKDLFKSGNDKRVISAMIRNFQKRANLLENVLQKINDINNFKTSRNENTII
ncbi:hypothetical protein [Aquimarina pacifica]|uniref:hypothetical protein n=1 Tax=Aquimarina pacifica TaxID=1296415 RepID=UPI000470AD82|nr:hypothetical protein [Aquimarina pacifica]